MQVNGKGGTPSATAASVPARAAAAQTAAPAPRKAAVTPAKATGQSAARKASLERRAALSSRGRTAVTSGDRRRSEATARARSAAAASRKEECGCGGDCCQESKQDTAPALRRPLGNGKVAKRQKPVAQPTSRLVSKARRNALSSKGKLGLDAQRKGISSASLARQANPEISGRDLARAVRDRRSRNGAQGATGAQTSRRRPRNAAEAKQQVSGTKVGHSQKLTGDESGLCHSGITGTEYMASEIFDQFCQGEPPKAPAKVSRTETLRGSQVTTGGRMGGNGRVTGAEAGHCREVTGSEYLGREHYAQHCESTPKARSAKVSQSQTQRGTVISGPSSSRSEKVSGNERGTCKAVTGTPYAGFEEYQSFCAPEEQQETRRRSPARVSGIGRDISGIQPGLQGKRLTGADDGACQSVSGTPYLAATELKEVCGLAPAQPEEADFPQTLGDTGPAVTTPAASVAPTRKVTGSGYEGPGSVTGAFSMGKGKVTGTEQARFGERSGNVITPEPVVETGDPVPRVTGEGIDTGLKITGDDWDRGERVTGTEGYSAAQRNPTRRGPMSAMPPVADKRDPQRERPSAPVTGGSGGSEGAAVTVSGGARG